LKQVVIEEHGKEPSAAHLKEIIDEARLLGVRKILLQSEFDKRHAESIAEEIGAEIITINPLSYDWREEMLRTAENIKTDLPE
jgi:zinc transport system substrate-binding protein